MVESQKPLPGMIDVDAVLFDMDGTLVDSTPVVERVWQQFATRFGVDLEALLAYSHGRLSQDTFERFLPDGNDLPAVKAEFERQELAETDGITEIPGARRLVDSLADRRVAVVTSAPRVLAVARLSAARIRIPQILVSADDVAGGKPDPEGYEMAARGLGVDPRRCLVMEDAEAGIQAGLASGAHVLVVGHHESVTTASLPRVVDLTTVTATASHDGITFRWNNGAEGPRD